ncbi:MAG: DUF4493 domain-containing protein [Bacteroides sp.]
MMRFIVEKVFTWLCALSLLVACTQESETDGVPSTGSGFLLSLSDRPMLTEESATTRLIPAALEKPVAANFQLTILPQGSKQPIYSGSFTSDPIPAGAGSYTLTARCGSNPQLAWDTPYYEGTAEATVTEGRYAEVTIPCRVANALLSVRFSNPSLFEQLYSDYGVTIQNGEYALRLTPENQTKSAYFPTGEVPSVRFTATLLANGQEVSFSLDNDLSSLLPLKAGQHIILTLSASNAAFTIEKIEVVDTTIDETLPDSWLPCPKVSDFGAINYVETNDAPTGSVISYTASRPIQAMELTFHFEDPQYALYNKTFKLHELTDEERTQLSTIGLSSLPQFGTDTKGTFNFAPLISTLQTNAGTTTVNTITLRVKANNRWSDEKTTAISNQITVEKPEFGVRALPGNIWTKEFTLSPISEDLVTEGKGNFAKLSQQMSYQFSADGTTWESLGNDLRKANLSAATTYYIRGLYRGAVPGLTCEVKTYPQTALVNGGLEEYQEVSGKDASTGNYGLRYEWTGWATINDLTCDYGVGVACSYNSRSGTRPTTTSQNGNAVWIATIGWGYGSSIFAIKYKTPGELFLGSLNDVDHSNDTATKEYGIDYNSHPTGLSFYYQYIPYDNDQTDIFIQIWSDETLLGEGTFKQGNTINNYTKQTIHINYLPGNEALAPNKLVVVFRSGINTSVEKKEINKVYYVGSQLFIDEVALVYDK